MQVKPMKLLIVTREIEFDKRYGLAKSLTPILEALGRKQVAITYLSQSEVTEKNEKRLRTFHHWFNKALQLIPQKWLKTNLYTLSWGLIERLNMGRLAAQVAQRDGYSHVHCHDPIIAAGFQRFRFFQRGKQKLQLSITQHGFGSYTQALHEDGVELSRNVMKRMRRWEARILSQTDWVFLPTEAGRQQLARDLAFYPIPENWRCIPHPKYPFAPLSREQARERLGWKSDCFHMISVGRQVPLKDFPTLIRACGQLQRQTKWHLTLLGDGDINPLWALAKDCGLDESKLLITSTDDMNPYYVGADLYISTSTTESFGMANHEALCAGLPCILTAVGGVPETAKNAVSYIPAKDVQSLHQAIDRLMTDPIQRCYLIQRAQQHAAQWPDIESIASAYYACYQKQEYHFNQTSVPARLPIQTDHWQQTLQTLPLFSKPTPIIIPEGAKVLIFSPHPDDETLSMGGTILHLMEKGCEIHVVLMAHCQIDAQLQSQREQEFEKVIQAYGIQHVHYLQQMDGNYRNTEAVRQHIQTIMQNIQADFLFSPPPFDLHQDHLQASLSILEVWHHLACSSVHYFYESWQLLPATHFVNTSDYEAKKIEILAYYQIPMAHFDYQGTCKSLRHFRSSIMADTFTAAEAFMIVQPENTQNLIDLFIQLRCYQAENNGLTHG